MLATRKELVPAWNFTNNKLRMEETDKFSYPWPLLMYFKQINNAWNKQSKTIILHLG
jgi:hypothetical protein